MKVDRLENTLNGGYKGLVGEVVEADIYRIRNINFIPGIVFDLGSNIGVFTRFARGLFPEATIICVEPDEENFYHLEKFTSHENIIFINAAIGVGEIYKRLGAVNGAHETYASHGTHYLFNNKGAIERSLVKTIMPDELIFDYLRPGAKSIMKLDIEMAEDAIWESPYSMQAMKQIDYICGESHYCMFQGNAQYEESKKTLEALHRFDETHHVEIEGSNFWLTKK